MNPSFTPDAAAAIVDDGVSPDDLGTPYLQVPLPGDAVQRLRRPGRVVTTDALLVDVGGDSGALVVYASEDFVGHEIEIARAEDPSGHPVHNVVRARRVCDAVVCRRRLPHLACRQIRASR